MTVAFKWPDHCDCCWPRRDERPAYYNPETGRAYCRHCQEMPGFWATVWGSKSRPIVRPAGPSEEKDAK